MGGYNIKLKITRPGHVYGMRQQQVENLYNRFLSPNSHISMDFGSADTDHIKVPGLSKHHLRIFFSSDKVVFHALAPVELTWRQRKILLDTGDKKAITIERLQQEPWQLSFLEKVKVLGKISSTRERLPAELQEYLTKVHGQLRQIQQGDFFLIFQNERQEVLKILRRSFSDKKEILKRVINSARKFQSLPGDLFLDIKEIAYHSDFSACYVVMDHFAGEPLQNYLARKGPLPLELTQKIVTAIAVNLAVMEKYGYCCRNINPENILLREQDGTVQIRICGFLLLKDQVSGLTGENQQMYIPKYTSPEQAKDPSTVDIRSDMFSLGAVFHALLVGEPPFHFGNAREYLRFLQQGRPFRPEQLQERAGHIPAAVCRLIARLLAFDKDQRPGPEDFLQRIKEDDDIHARCQDVVDTLEPLPRIVSLPSTLQEDETIDSVCSELAEDLDQAVADKQKPSPGEDKEQFSTSFLELLNNVEKQLDSTASSPGQYFLQIVEGNLASDQRSRYNIIGNASVIIGAKGDFAIDDPQLSPEHAKIETSNDGCWLYDLESEGGTYLDGQKISKSLIRPGSRFRIGSTEILLGQKRSVIGDTLSNSQEDLSLDDIDSLRVLTISTQGATNKKLRVMYEQLEQRQAEKCRSLSQKAKKWSIVVRRWQLWWLSLAGWERSSA